MTMLIQRMFRFFVPKAVVAMALLAISGCWTGPAGLLADEESVDIVSLFEEGQHVFENTVEGNTVVATLEISPGLARFRFGEADWQAISGVKAIPISEEGFPEILHIAVIGQDDYVSYSPFFHFSDGIAVKVVGATANEPAELLDKARSSVPEGGWSLFHLVPPGEIESAFLRARETAAREAEAKEQQEAQKRAEAAKQRAEREERERQQREEREKAATFRSDGYAVPRLFEAIHSGNTGGWRSADYALYLQSFALVFYNAGDDRSCNAVITAPAVAALAITATGDTLGKLLGPLVTAHRQGSSGRDGAFRDGAKAGVEGTMSLLQAETRGRSDARLFYSRHTCVSPAAIRFFANFNRFVIRD